MFCNKCLCLFLSYVHAPSRIRHASQVCVSVLHFFIVTVQHPMFSALPPVLSTFFLVPAMYPLCFVFPRHPHVFLGLLSFIVRLSVMFTPCLHVSKHPCQLFMFKVVTFIFLVPQFMFSVVSNCFPQPLVFYSLSAKQTAGFLFRMFAYMCVHLGPLLCTLHGLPTLTSSFLSYLDQYYWGLLFLTNY